MPDLTGYDDVREAGHDRHPMPGSVLMTRTASPQQTRTAADVPDTADLVSDLFRRYANRVYGYVRLRTTPEIADDVVADTFLTAWRLRDRIPEEPLPWLLVVAHNMLANRHRAVGRSTRLVVAMARVEQLAGYQPAAEDAVVARDEVLGVLARLTDDERGAVLLVAWDGLSHRDAAAVAGCSERTLARRLRRARYHLRDLAAPATVATAAATTADPMNPGSSTDATDPTKESS
ncbi:MAG: RNA polymerase sigma factor [Actinobacteria bacterium]|nr:RNA polymerase sigma factor [Actinomycetota bacterium]